MYAPSHSYQCQRLDADQPIINNKPLEGFSIQRIMYMAITYTCKNKIQNSPIVTLKDYGLCGIEISHNLTNHYAWVFIDIYIYIYIYIYIISWVDLSLTLLKSVNKMSL